MLDDMDKPLTKEDGGENDLFNPYGKASCLMLYLYSMELGDPPLYAEVNRVCRFMDKRQLANLGPFIRALKNITEFAEGEKVSEEKQAGTFLLFRGA